MEACGWQVQGDLNGMVKANKSKRLDGVVKVAKLAHLVKLNKATS